MKRRRTDTGFVTVQRATKRPIDKELKTMAQTSVTTSVSSTTLKTTTFPGTVVGLRWDLSAMNIITTDSPMIAWAIVVIPDGEAANTPALSDGADFYTPEQNVLAFGTALLADVDAGAGNIQQHFNGSTKAMRKLKQGDVLSLVAISSVANSVSLRGVVQFFFKT